MSTAIVELRPRIELGLSHEEALWLQAYCQNFMGGGAEDPRSKLYREGVFTSLKDATDKLQKMGQLNTGREELDPMNVCEDEAYRPCIS